MASTRPSSTRGLSLPTFVVRPFHRLRVGSLVRASRSHYRAKNYEKSLEAATAAVAHAKKSIGAASQSHADALFHLAATYAAMNRHDEALSHLDACHDLGISMHGGGSLRLVPILHALAEVHEEVGGLHGANEAILHLESCQRIRLGALGKNRMQYAFSCSNLANLLLRCAASHDMPLCASSRADYTQRAADLALEAVAVAKRASDEPLGIELAGEVLDAIVSCKLGTLAANAAAIQQLRDVTGSISSDLTTAAECVECVEPRQPKSPMATSSKQGENGQPAVALDGTDDEKRVAKIQNDVHSAFKRVSGPSFMAVQPVQVVVEVG